MLCYLVYVVALSCLRLHAAAHKQPVMESEPPHSVEDSRMDGQSFEPVVEIEAGPVPVPTEVTPSEAIPRDEDHPMVTLQPVLPARLEAANRREALAMKNSHQMLWGQPREALSPTSMFSFRWLDQGPLMNTSVAQQRYRTVLGQLHLRHDGRI